MNIEALSEMAGYLEKGDFGGRTFSMGCYNDCVLGHTAARELEATGTPVTQESLHLLAPGISKRVYGITQSTETESWQFAFGAQWGEDRLAAADRLRYLARHGGAPSKDQWDAFRKHPQPVAGGGKVEESKDGELTYSTGYGPVVYGTSGENCVVTDIGADQDDCIVWQFGQRAIVTRIEREFKDSTRRIANAT